MADVFEHTHYKDFLKESFPVTGEKRGGRSRLAEFLDCKLGFVSQVLSGDADFSFEYGILISEYLGMNAEEQNYFLLLMQRDRAGSAKLRTFFDKKIDALLGERKEVRSRIGKTKDLTVAEKNLYYSRWLYNALHMCALIPRLRNPERSAKYLGVSLEEVNEILRELEKMQLIERRPNGDFHSTTRRLHLGEKSLALRAHHTNWRMEAIRTLDRRANEQLHYSSVMSISQDAAAKIRKLLLKVVQDSEPVIRDAADEDVFVLTMDLFSIRQA